jgi:hypothetical protein
MGGSVVDTNQLRETMPRQDGGTVAATMVEVSFGEAWPRHLYRCD